MDLALEFSDSCSNSFAAEDSDHFSASAFQIEKQAQSKNWTDDMHWLYLESLEASFVKELHNSLQLRAVGNKITMMQTNCAKCMVLRDGCWQKIEYKMSECMMDSTADSTFFRRGIQSSLNRSLLSGSSTSFGGSPGNFKPLIEYDFIYQDSAVSTSEVSDQNLVDDVPVRASGNTTGSK